MVPLEMLTIFVQKFVKKPVEPSVRHFNSMQRCRALECACPFLKGRRDTAY